MLRWELVETVALENVLRSLHVRLQEKIQRLCALLEKPPTDISFHHEPRFFAT